MKMLLKLSLCRQCYFLLRPKQEWFAKRHYTNRNILRLSERGLYQELFPDNSAAQILDLLNGEPQTVYAGFDPTADSLHIGNLLIIIGLLHWQRAGHKVIALIGGGTAQVGDPSGRSKDRPEQAKSHIESNADIITENIKQIFQNHEEYFWSKESQASSLKPVRIVNNSEWYDKMKALEFIGNLGRHFRVGKMLGKESVRTRMNSENGISFTEFTYQVLQAYDWLHLYKEYQCRFQLGGSDQLGNIVAGYEFIKKKFQEPVYGFTLPLVTTEEGEKFGKSSGNALWLSGNKTSPFQLYQFFIRVKDSEVEKLLLLFTFEKISTITDIMNEQNKQPEKRIAQKKLAESVVYLVHGEKGVQQALKATSVLYNKDIEELGRLSLQDLQEIFPGAITVTMLLEPEMTVLKLAMDAKCFSREVDAIRTMSQGGFSINHQRCRNMQEMLSKSAHILPNNISLLGVGKKVAGVVLFVAYGFNIDRLLYSQPSWSLFGC